MRRVRREHGLLEILKKQKLTVADNDTGKKKKWAGPQNHGVLVLIPFQLASVDRTQARAVFIGEFGTATTESSIFSKRPAVTKPMGGIYKAPDILHQRHDWPFMVSWGGGPNRHEVVKEAPKDSL